MKLFLASSLDKTLHLLVPRLTKAPCDTKVIFIANAADPYKDAWWVDSDRKEFLRLGFMLQEADLRTVSRNELIESMQGADIVHVCGGSVFYLMSVLRVGGADTVITDAVKSGSVIYTGTSAGSIVVSRLLTPFSYDEEEKIYMDKVPDKRGLGLVDFVIIPHSNNAELQEEYKNMIGHASEYPDPLIFLSDNHAILVEDSKFEILSL